MPRITNWLGNVSHMTREVVRPTRVEEIQEVLRNSHRYPCPVRVSGANHSVTEVAVAEQGTFIDMRKMNRIDPPVTVGGVTTITAEAGARYICVAKTLRGERLHTNAPFQPGFQLFVNCEIGSLTMGAAASGATKDSSFFPDEYGQVGSYVRSVKMVKPDGSLITIDETTEDPWSLKTIRSGYGLLGVIYEVTIEVKPHTIMKVWHEELSLDEFLDRLPGLNQNPEGSVFAYMFPYEAKIVLEHRSYPDPNASTGDISPWLFALRNFAWQYAVPEAGGLTGELADKLGLLPGIPALEFLKRNAIQTQHDILRNALVHKLYSDHTSPTDQIVDFKDPPHALQRFGFSMWAFPFESFGRVLRDYFELCRNCGYQTTMPHVSYRIKKDQNSLLSYSYDSDVWTLDPASAACGGDEQDWEEFLRKFNGFCSRENGKPLFNQTPLLTRAQALRAYGDRLTRFEALRRQCDPQNRLLNQYFKDLLPP